jgi:hypothetical protein
MNRRVHLTGAAARCLHACKCRVIYLISVNWPLSDPSGLNTLIVVPMRRTVKQRSCAARMLLQVVQ